MIPQKQCEKMVRSARRESGEGVPVPEVLKNRFMTPQQMLAQSFLPICRGGEARNSTIAFGGR